MPFKTRRRRPALLVPVLLSLLLTGLAASRAEAHDPEPGATRGEARRLFLDALSFGCLYTRTVNIPIDALPAGLDDDLVPADAQDRRGGLVPPDHPMLVSKRMGNLIEVYIDKTGDCVVTALQLPVQATLDSYAEYLRKVSAAFKERPYKPGYNPIGYEFARQMDDGDEIVIHMEGAEPGRWGHALRFSLIVVRVSRRPAAATAPH